mmetsp:Transcript_2442/g.6133  ORF Transcript_2442/g.6133 Transcript_2442/m.6133 type:complete len:177 (+) Transcript_2442:1-531(+)
MNPHDLAGHQLCGLCVRVWASGEGAGGDPMHWDGDLFRVDNLCPECKKGDLDFAREGHGDGRWDITWQAVACPTEPGGIHYMLDSGDNKYFVKERPLNVPTPVTKMEMKDGGKWQEGKLHQSHYGFEWNTKGVDAVDVRLTFADGETMTDRLPQLASLVDGTNLDVPEGVPDGATR